MRQRIEVTIKFSVDEEIAPGLFYDPLDFAKQACDSIKYTLQAYNPTIETTDIKRIPKDKD